jgi:SAM-dependent methyltransferase
LADREEVRKLARESIERGDAIGWFEELYQGAGGEWQRLPWADLVPNPYLVEWLRRSTAPRGGRSCLVVGCGLGDDAEIMAEEGYSVTAFDVSATAIEGCRTRFPTSPVEYVVADVLVPPVEWVGRFHLVFESYTLQVLPPEARIAAMNQLAGVVSRQGQLLVLCRGRECEDSAGQLPWPITKEELGTFGRTGLREISFEDFLDAEVPPVRRFRVLYGRE